MGGALVATPLCCLRENIMVLTDIKKRIEELINFGEALLRTREPEYDDVVNVKLFREFRTSSLSIIRRIYGEKWPHYCDFDKEVSDENPYRTKLGIGILKSIKSEIEGGWLFDTKGLISAEIFSDFIEMAEYLLSESYKDAAAVIIGSVLEEHLKHLCQKNTIEKVYQKDGKSIKKKADRLNSELASINVYNKLDQKSVTAWLDLRNKAAHGEYSEYSKEQVELVLNQVRDFIARTS